MIGLALPVPGMATFHSMPSLSSFTGRFCLSAMPVPLGPRKRVQCPASATEAIARVNANPRQSLRIVMRWDSLTESNRQERRLSHRRGNLQDGDWVSVAVVDD